MAYLREIYIKFEQKYAKKESITTTKISKSEMIVNDILKSGYSMEEYGANKGILISKIYLVIRDTNIYKEHYDELNNRSEKFEQLIKNLIYGILYENMDILDYYMQTNLDLNDFLRISKQLLSSPSDIIKISQFVKKNLNLIKTAIVNKNQEMKTACSINGHEITIEEKEKIFTFLEQNNIPLKLYHFALRKYLNGNLDLEQKVKSKN